MPRSRSRSPRNKDKKHRSKRRDTSSSESREAVKVKKQKSSTKNKSSSIKDDKAEYSIQTRSRKNSEVYPNGAGSGTVAADSLLSPGKQTKSVSNFNQNPGDLSNFPEITRKTIEGLQAQGILSLFPIQYMTFKNIYNREDLIGRDLTGSGKTLAFCLPLVERLRADQLFKTGQLQAIILAPTRELALQISRTLSDLKHQDNEYSVITVYGGTSISDQAFQLRKGVDIFVGTTGRVLDHIERGNLKNFSQLKAVILDEADQMLNMGFKEDVDKILKCVKETTQQTPQFLLFSATIPRWIQDLAHNYLQPNWQLIDLAKNLAEKTQKNINHISINCPYHNRQQTLADLLTIYGGTGQTIVFTSTKVEANNLILSDKINKDIEVMHGDIAQNQREVTLKRFKEHKFSVLVATDVAARGLDVPNVELVIQVEPPKDCETYIHRAGRTARAGKAGTCITFWTQKHKPQLLNIERRAGLKFIPIGIPQPHDVIKATSRDTIKQLKTVNDDVLNLFTDTADELIALEDGDSRAALLKALAFISGCHKEKMTERSLLTGTENFVTFQIDLQRTFQGLGLVWNVLRRYVPEKITEGIKGMRGLSNQQGAVFDIQENHVEQFIDIIEDSKGKTDFDVYKCKNLPDLYEAGPPGGNRFGGGGGYQNGGNRFGGGGRGGYQNGGDRFGGRGGGDRYGSRPPMFQGGGGGGRQQRNQDASVFVGNLDYSMDQGAVSQMFSSQGLRPISVRVLQDDQGMSKGSAFVDFENPDQAKRAIGMDGSRIGGGSRPLRINSAKR